MTILINYCSKKKVLRTCAAKFMIAANYDLYITNKYLNITFQDYPPSLSYIKKTTTHTHEHNAKK